ncbi:MAG TPA: SPOR domain-containing protein [Aequorivita sp.]|nr:SPOR domain-containing protein [Aequorivita sp.]
MQLSNYISDLLYRYECVIIPGFGAFLTRYKSAWIDEKSHTFYPPSKVVSFNRQLQANDGLLANYVASVDKCSYEVALQRIRKFTAKMANDLQEGKKIDFKNVGEFSLNHEKSIQFEPVQEQNFSASAFGLTTFISPRIGRELTEEVRKEEKPVVVMDTASRETRPYLKYAAIAILAISATGFAGMKLYESEVQKYNFAQRQKASTLVDNQIQQATFVIENPLPVLSLSLPKQIGNYHIVAGAYKMEDNAEKKMEQLREKGYFPLKLATSAYGLHQVLYASFENRLEAIKNLHQIQREENPDAWLLVKQIEDRR